MTSEQLNLAIASLPSKGTNVTTALLRIKGLRDILALHGLELDLATPNGTNLEKIVREYNKIVKQEIPGVFPGIVPDAITVDNKQFVRVVAGYYPNDFFITGSNSLADLEAAIKAALDDLKKEIRANVASPSLVVVGAKVPIIIENPNTHELTVLYVEGNVGAPYVAGTSDTRVSAGTKDELGNVKIITANGDTLSSNIPYYDGGFKEVQIVVKEETTLNGDSETATVLEADALPSGYYANKVRIVPVLDKESSNKVVNVLTGKTVYILDSGEITVNPDAGFDYLKNTIVRTAAGSSKVTASIAGNKVNLIPNVNAGWIKTTEIEGTPGTSIKTNEDGSYTITLPTKTAENSIAIAGAKDLDNDGAPELVVTIPDGTYINDTTIPVTLNGKEVLYITLVADPLPDNQGNPTVYIPSGIVSQPIFKGLGKSNINIDTTEIEDAENTLIQSAVTFVSTLKGYTYGEAKKLIVKSASTPELTTTKIEAGGQLFDKVVVNIQEGGWAEGETDVSEAFAVLATQYANGYIDREGGKDVTIFDDYNESGEVVFTYAENLDEVKEGIQVKAPKGNNRYFTSARVDLSALIHEIDEI